MTIEKLVWNYQIPYSLWMSGFTREELRNIARHYNIPRGRNKQDTAQNLLTSGVLNHYPKFQLYLTFSV